MQCATCGTHNTRVISTRSEPGHMIVRRRHECGNLHRFNTYQVHESTVRGLGLANLQSKAEKHAMGIVQRSASWRRRSRAEKMLAEGKTPVVIAAAVGLSAERIRQFRREALKLSSSLRKDHTV